MLQKRKSLATTPTPNLSSNSDLSVLISMKLMLNQKELVDIPPLDS